MGVESDSTNGIVRPKTVWMGGLRAFVVDDSREGSVSETGSLAGLRIREAVAFTVENKFGVINEVHSVGAGESFSARAHEVDMRALFKHQAGSVDWIAQALDTGHSSGLHAAAVHQQGVKLHAPV